MNKKCNSCRWASGDSHRHNPGCNYILYHEESRTAQAYRACGVEQATEETDRMLSGYTCAFYEKGERMNSVTSGVILPGSCMHPKSTRSKKPCQYDWDKALEMYKAGAQSKEIAAELGCSKCAVENWKIRERLTGQRPRPQHVFNYEQAKELYLSGATVKEVAAALGCAEKTAAKYKREAGLTGQRRIDWDKGRELLESGATPDRIAAALACSERTVTDWASKEGLKW